MMQLDKSLNGSVLVGEKNEGSDWYIAIKKIYPSDRRY